MRRPSVLNVIALGVVAVLAAGCGDQEAARPGSAASSAPPATSPTSPDPSASPTASPTADPSTSPPATSPPASPSPTDAPSPSPTKTPPPGADTLAAAEKLWKTKSLSSYSFIYEPSCFCPRTKIEVTVVNGAVTSVKKAPRQDDPFDHEYVPELADAPSIEKLFAELRRAYGEAEPAAAVQVTYDAAYGFPTSAYIDWDTMMADEESGYSVSKFAAAPGIDVAGTWRPKTDNGAFITFNADGTYVGSDGCNGSSGTWSTASGKLVIATGAHTEIGCDNQIVDEWIAKADTVTVAADTMTIVDAEATRVLHRRK